MEDAISVSTLGGYLKRIIDSEELLHRIKVFGEISAYSMSDSIAFFTLKDENAIMQCLLFDANRLSPLKIGDKVVVTGSPSYYVKGGKLSFNAEKIEQLGEGQLYKNFLILKEKLEREGLFGIERKKPLPAFIKRIGVVTSETGAVIQDIINVTYRRNSQIDIVLFPVKVQGLDAEKEIAKGIDYFSASNVDAVIVARGGGSGEDLMAYNTEIVVRSIANCKKFLVSAVGHETDYTLVDFVSDLRAPTPSAAAELLVRETVSDIERLSNYQKSLISAIELILNKSENSLEQRYQTCVRLMEDKLSAENFKFSMLVKDLNSLNPLEILSKGYAKLEIDGKRVTSVRKLKTGGSITSYLSDGNIKSVITEVNSK